MLASSYEAVFGTISAHSAVSEWLDHYLMIKGKILDIGCGTGLPAAKLFADKGHQVTGIDVSSEMIRVASANVPDGFFFEMNVTDLRFPDESFQGIVALATLLLLSKDDFIQSLSEIHRVLAPKGLFILSMVEGDEALIETPILFRREGSEDWFTIPGASLSIAKYPESELQRLLSLKFRVLWVRKYHHLLLSDVPESHICICCQRQ